MERIADYKDTIATSLPKAAKMLGISKPKVYQIAREDSTFPVFRLGGRTLVSVDGLRAWVNKQASRGEAL